jgi:Protein of unknown function (DUF3072)
MSENAKHAPNETAEKDPADWVTGDEPHDGTAAQLSAHTGAGSR